MTVPMDVWMDEIVFGESPRWHGGRLWFSDWGAGRVWSVAQGAEPVLEAEVESLMCIDFLPDGRLLVVSPGAGLLRREPDGSLVPHADLSAITATGWNDIVCDAHGRAYVNSIGFDFPGGEFRPGLVALVDADGSVRTVAEGLAFPNGMAIAPDGSTLVVAESYAEKLTAYPIADDGSLGSPYSWAATPGDHPDGICFDASGALWYADVGNQHCVRVREGGEVLDVVDSDRGAFACALTRDGQGLDRPLLLVVGQEWGPDTWGGGRRTGQLVAHVAPEHGDGWP
ncbi:SMP-30/gluconolactonase/LRE family protein [Nocardioides agariphilus]|nr:SMP-30/gluconolactonase/LRE family protein [Nocardioides agariphilus]